MIYIRALLITSAYYKKSSGIRKGAPRKKNLFLHRFAGPKTEPGPRTIIHQTCPVDWAYVGEGTAGGEGPSPRETGRQGSGSG
ncbi:hypothetical protein GWI33_016300 [Rhynchophorus ferrugineus]|uniref:Uncharacterized protein n=1 Tax=Rhynchophorus ferrugineus TaxID=354439 RepID=A0A834IBD3_RHYFE|nr:hypothetical protein GWI33_016300 [Rhynchophorus ferrugineus]